MEKFFYWTGIVYWTLFGLILLYSSIIGFSQHLREIKYEKRLRKGVLDADRFCEQGRENTSGTCKPENGIDID